MSERIDVHLRTSRKKGIENKSPDSLGDGEIELLKKKYFMLGHVIDGILKGKFSELTEEEIEKMVQNSFFSFDPLVQLTEEQENLLRDQTVVYLKKFLNKNAFQVLCGPIMSDGTNLYTQDSLEIFEQEGRTIKGRLLSPSEKIRMIFRPMSEKHSPRLTQGRSTSGIESYGNRNFGEGYGIYSDEEFFELLNSIRAECGVQRLNVLDIGCGVGRALIDMKKLDSNMETHGITQEQEASTEQEVDFIHYINGERVPAEFRNKFHLIFSMNAFQYFPFPHIALRNVLLSLARGGSARLMFGHYRSSNTDQVNSYLKKFVPDALDHQEVMKVLCGKEIAKLNILQKRGKIKYITSSNFSRSNEGYLGIEKIAEFDEDDERLINMDNFDSKRRLQKRQRKG